VAGSAHGGVRPMPLRAEVKRSFLFSSPLVSFPIRRHIRHPPPSVSFPCFPLFAPPSASPAPPQTPFEKLPGTRSPSRIRRPRPKCPSFFPSRFLQDLSETTVAGRGVSPPHLFPMSTAFNLRYETHISLVTFPEHLPSWQLNQMMS